MRAKAIVVLTFLLFSFRDAQASTQKVLYTFTGGVDGGQPYAGVIFDSAGNLYGVTQAGGAYGWGTVFELTPSPSGAWTETVLYNFTGGTDGGNPLGGLAIDGSGNLYGTTVQGGDPSAQCGTVFELSPSGGGWTFAVERTFFGAPKDGCAPIADLFLDQDNHLWYETSAGGAYNQGAAFDHVMASFGASKGGDPSGAVNSWGFGTAFNGGGHGAGAVYYLNFQCNDASPDACKATVLPKHAFSGGKGGSNPSGDLLQAIVGGAWVMYGTTYGGGNDNHGIVYQLTQTAKGGWGFSVLHSFSGPDGDGPSAGLTADAAGNLYGTTSLGGSEPGYDGTVFKLTPSVGKKNKVIWNLTTVYSFSGGADGGEVTSGVVFNNAGNLYGTTLYGGAYGQGVVYEVTP